MWRVLTAIICASAPMAAITQPIDESAQIIQDETYFLASQGISIWNEDTDAGDKFWVSLHDYKISPDGKAFSGRVRGYHKRNASVPYRLSIVEIGGICVTNKIGVTNWRTYSATGKVMADHLGNVRDGMPTPWPMLDRILADRCDDREAKQP